MYFLRFLPSLVANATQPLVLFEELSLILDIPTNSYILSLSSTKFIRILSHPAVTRVPRSLPITLSTYLLLELSCPALHDRRNTLDSPRPNTKPLYISIHSHITTTAASTSTKVRPLLLKNLLRTREILPLSFYTHT